METANKTNITVQTTVNAPVDKVWKYWSAPEHITKWNNASDDWHSPRAENDLRTGGKFFTRMEAKDGSFGFDFGGVYDEVKNHELIDYTMGDGRKVSVKFSGEGNQTKIVETFEAEETHSIEMQNPTMDEIVRSVREADNVFIDPETFRYPEEFAYVNHSYREFKHRLAAKLQFCNP